MGRSQQFLPQHQRWLLEEAGARNWDPVDSNKATSRAFYGAVLAKWIENFGYLHYTSMTEEDVLDSRGSSLGDLDAQERRRVLRNRDKAKKILREVGLLLSGL
jgi:hypothetical protein